MFFHLFQLCEYIDFNFVCTHVIIFNVYRGGYRWKPLST